MSTVSIVPDSAPAVLFDPFDLGPLRLKNRLIMAPMGTCLDSDHMITDRAIAYYVRRARGGIGTITVEGCLISEQTAGPEPKISGPQYLPGLSRLVAALKRYDVTVGVQLMHPGRQVASGPSVAPSPVALNSRAPVPQELTDREILAIVDDYAAAARLAEQAGFDFVEVHGAHGYLPSNFLSPLDNRRTDRWGGSLINRARFSVEVAGAIVAAVGTRLPLVWRINGEDAIAGGFTLADCLKVARLIEQAGAAAISVSAGTWHTLDVTLAPMFVARGHMRHLAAAVKATVDLPVIAVGRLDDPQMAADVIASGEADLIAIGRALIAEPDWPQKVATGKHDELRPCIACNACVDLVGRGEVARCAVNPEVGRESSWQLEPTRRARRIMVVGSGPAGMEAARIARLRGHEVSIWERGERLGGKLEVAGSAPSKREVLRFRDFQARRLAALGVAIHTAVNVDVATIAAERPEVVLVATGAEPMIPPIAGIDGDNVYDAQRILAGEIAIAAADRVVIVGGSATGCETAEHAVAIGAEVTIIEMRRSIGTGVEAITRRRLVRELKRAGVSLFTSSKVIAIEPDVGMVVYQDQDERRQSVGADIVALAIGWRPSGAALAERLQAVDTEVIVLGDAACSADFVAAINAGADAGLAV